VARDFERIDRFIERRLPFLISIISTPMARAEKAYERYYVEDKGDRYIIVVELPGASKESIHVYVRERSIYVHAKNEVKIGHLPSEYNIKINLEEEIDVDNVKAKYHNGILTIEAYKKIKGREIKVT